MSNNGDLVLYHEWIDRDTFNEVRSNTMFRAFRTAEDYARNGYNDYKAEQPFNYKLCDNLTRAQAMAYTFGGQLAAHMKYSGVNDASHMISLTREGVL